MPRWLSRVLPAFDVEGEGLAREIEHRQWPTDMPHAVIAADRLALRGGLRLPELRVSPGETLLLDPRDPLSLPLAEVLTGRGSIVTGTVKVDGLLLPERASSLRARSAWADPESLRDALRDRPSVVVLDLRAAGERPMPLSLVESAHSALAAAQIDGVRGSAPAPTVIALGSRELAERLLPRGAVLVAPSRPAAGRPEHAPALPGLPDHPLAPAAGEQKGL
jgi:RND superfamily putative drug exporter